MALFLGLASLHAETTSASGATAITSLPYPISTSGTYYLMADLAVNNQNGITISANNVTLDLNGHTLTDSSSLISGSTGINITGANVSVLNGQLTGFAYGVYTTGSNTRIEKIAMVGVTYLGIFSNASNTCIKSCRLLNTGGSTGVVDAAAYGMVLVGDNVRVLDCDIIGLTLRQNSQNFAIWNGGASGQIIGNRVGNCEYGIGFVGSTSKYRDNTCMSDVQIPYEGAGTDAGNNN